MFLFDEAMSKQLYFSVIQNQTVTSQTKQSVIGLIMNDYEINRVEDSGEVYFGMNMNVPLESRIWSVSTSKNGRSFEIKKRFWEIKINNLGMTMISLLNLSLAFWDKSGSKSEFILNNSRSNQPFRSSVLTTAFDYRLSLVGNNL